MTSFVTFYLSRVIGKRVYDKNGNLIGFVKDLLIESEPVYSGDSTRRPIVHGIALKINKEIKYFSFKYFEISKIHGKIKVECSKLDELPAKEREDSIPLAELIMDKQIVDLNGRKVVRVNDVRIVTIANGSFAIAVDVGMEGLLRRIGIAKPLKAFLSLFNGGLPSKFILWDDMEAIDYSNLNIKLSTSYSKLNTLHPSDLADIIEDLDNATRKSLFAALDEERAADVLEEMEPHAQINIVESLPVEKIADLLEKMPANEAADIIDALEDDKAELLLKEMEAGSSQEVRELLEYDDNEVGSIMTTEILAFNENMTVDSVLNELRIKKPEADALYNMFVIDDNEELVATFSLRDMLVSESTTSIRHFMKTDPLYLYDTQEVDEIAEMVSKYNLLAIPVVNSSNQLQGMVVIDDIIEDLVSKRRTNKK
ncbi:MAG: CBS domain-containing protein [Bacteroidota bacterium]|nr:CBS domain-containing protein [Bacteroidota bacterium]